MEWVDMVAAEIDRSDREYEQYLATKPHCQICNEPITDEWCYDLSMDGNYVHKDCIREVARYMPEHLKWIWYEMVETLNSTDSYVRTPEPDE